MFPLSGQNKPDIDGAEELRGEISVGRHRPRAWEHPQTRRQLETTQLLIKLG